RDIERASARDIADRFGRDGAREQLGHEREDLPRVAVPDDEDATARGRQLRVRREDTHQAERAFQATDVVVLRGPHERRAWDGASDGLLEEAHVGGPEISEVS